MNMNQLYRSAQTGRELIRRRVRSPLTKLLLAAATLGSTFSHAQSPGGVSANLRVWLRSDNGFTPSSWTDGSGNANHYTQTNASRQPFVAADYYNFNPVVDFGTSGSNARFMVVPAGKPYSANGTSSSVFTVNLDRSVGGYADILGFGATTTSASLINANSPVFTRLGTNVVNYPYTDSNPALPAVAVNKLYLNDVSFTVGTAGIKYGQNGTTSANTQTFNAVYSRHADGSVLGSQPEVRNGLIGEVIAYERDLSEAEKQRVRTYIAIKYGITLPHNYIASNGSTSVWNQSANTGYNNNIAGIGRDENSALHQKQSSSINDGKQVLIGTAGLANTNALNTTGLTDGQFLVWGDNGLPKTPSVTANNLGADVNARFASIWKVQNVGTGTVRVAWPKSFDNLKLVQSADAVIDGSDVITAMSAETAPINGVVYNYVDVTLTNGTYFTFAAKVGAPGGVSGPVVWLKADQGTTVSGTSVSGWANYGISGGVAGQLARNASVNWALPKFGTNEHNFNPAIVDDVTNSNDGSLLLADVFPESAYRPLSSFVLQSHPNVASANNMISFTPLKQTDGALEAPYLSGYTAGRLWFYWQGRYEWAPTLPNSVVRINNIPSVSAFYVPTPNTAHKITIGMNGATADGPVVNAGPTAYPFGNQLFIFGDGGANNTSGGKTSEIITYDRDLTLIEKQQINSYLAVKYGITQTNPGGTAVANYLNSSGAVVWDATANAAYSKNVAGIANDAGSTLNQKQSRSVNAGSQVLISTTGLANNNATNSASLSNGQYLIWGDNGLGKVPAIAISGVSGVNFRFASVWKVQNTSSVGTVRVTWPAGLTNLTLIQGTDPAFASVASSTLMTSNTISVNGVSYNYADVTLADGQYFTFATQLNGPGGVALNLRVWLRSDAGFAPDSWADLSGSGNNYTQTNATRQPFTASKLYNFNPAVDFGANGADARFMVVPNGRPYTANGSNSTLFTAFVNRSVGGYADIIGFGATTTGAGLIQANSPVYTTLGNSPRLYPYSNSVQTVVSNKLYLNDVSFTVGSGGIKYGQNGDVRTETSNFASVYADHANGSVLGSQGEERNGLIGEVIAFQRDLPEAEKQRVRTYVAIKYGITLPHNYIAANATTTFWDQTANAGYIKNIAGIARDDQGSLSQKQSWSINSSKEVLISTTGLADDNASNATLLNDQQFLVWGDNGLAKAPGVSLGTISGLPYNRFASIWKVQNTGSVGTVRVAWAKGYANLKLVQSSDATIDLSDVITEMSSTITIGGKEYAYADVTLADGSFFTFAAFVQGPGGVTNNLTHWYRADYNVESQGDGTDASEWADFNGGVISSQLGDSNMPKFKAGAANYFNFNPGVNFTLDNQKLGNISERTLSSQDFDIFTATKEGMTNGRFFNIGVNNTTFNGTNWDHPGLYGSGAIGRRNVAGSTLVNGGLPGNPNFPDNTPAVTYYAFTNTSVVKGTNGAPKGTVYAHGAIGDVLGGHMFGANSGDATSGDDGGFVGNIGELVIYGAGSVSETDRNKIDSYLAIKYGITMAAGANYTTSAGTVVWNATTNAAYQNNIAGIGNDFRSALVQKQSRSQITDNSNNQVTIGLGGIAATNEANTSQLTDGQFLIWGDNNNKQNLGNAYAAFDYAGSPTNGRRMNRIWKVQNTNNVSNEVLVRFPVASVGTTSFGATDACADYVIIFADDAAFTTNVSVQGLTVNGTDYDIAHTFPNGASYFTYGKVIPFNQGTVYLTPVTQSTDVSSNTCDIGTWKYFRQTSDNSQKLMGITGYTAPELANLSVTITTEGTSFDNGTRKTNLMPRITTVTNTGAATLSAGKVRIYFSQSEQAATTVNGQQSFGWYKYEGTADDVIANVFDSGVLDATKAIQLSPNATGVEDGVNYVEFHNITSFSSFIYLSTTESSALPVKLTYFNATKEADVANLNWRTTEESNNTGFEIQRSSNARDWNAIGFVENQTEGGNSKGILTYKFTDATPLKGINYYRLKQIDADGSSMLSSIVSLRFQDGKGSLFVYPNPVINGKLTLSLPQAGVYTMSVYNVSGVEVLKVKQTETTVDVSKLATGMYVMKVTYANGETHNKSFIVK